VKAFIAIVRSAAGKLEKFQDFDTQAEADTHVSEWGGWVSPNPGGDTKHYWVIDEAAKTIGYDQANQDSDQIMKQWISDITATDESMTRQMEDYIDDQGIALKPGRTKDAYDEKKAIRARQPT